MTTDRYPNKQMKRKTEEVAQDLTAAGRRAWLAGLGAFARVEEGGRELADTLIARGRKVERRQFQAVDRTVARTSEALEDLADWARGGVESGVAGTLHRMGLPTREDLETLSARLDALSEKLDHVQV